MKRILMSLVCCLMLFSLTGCGKNEIETLMDDNKYQEAYDLIKKDEDKYGDYKDECAYYIGKKAFDDKKYSIALSYFKDNNFKKLDKEIDECRYHVALYHIGKFEYNEAKEYLKNNSFKDAGNLLSSINNEVKNYYTIATTVKRSDLDQDSLDLYSYGDITFTSSDCEWIDNPINKEGSVNQGAFYRKMATSLEGFKLGFNNGISLTEHILGEIAFNGSLIKPRVDELSSYIVEKDSLKAVMNKFKSLSTITGTINVDANSYDFTITDLTACADELKISEEMLGYILAMLDEYAPTVSFEGHSYNFKLN